MVGKHKTLEGFYPGFGAGGSDQHLLFHGNCYQAYTPANACALTTIGMILSFHQSLSFVEGSNLSSCLYKMLRRSEQLPNNYGYGIAFTVRVIIGAWPQ